MIGNRARSRACARYDRVAGRRECARACLYGEQERGQAREAGPRPRPHRDRRIEGGGYPPDGSLSSNGARGRKKTVRPATHVDSHESVVSPIKRKELRYHRHGDAEERAEAFVRYRRRVHPGDASGGRRVLVGSSYPRTRPQAHDDRCLEGVRGVHGAPTLQARGRGRVTMDRRLANPCQTDVRSHTLYGGSRSVVEPTP